MDLPGGQHKHRVTLLVSPHWWYCGGHKDLQGLRSEKSGYFPQPDLSLSKNKRSSSFLGWCRAYLALTVKQRQGWRQHEQPELASCGQQCYRAGKERESERQKESGRLEGGGEISF